VSGIIGVLPGSSSCGPALAALSVAIAQQSRMARKSPKTEGRGVLGTALRRQPDVGERALVAIA
jgi:hypothetical protein